MKFDNYDISILIKECEKFLCYINENEIDNDCNTIEQIFINAANNIMLSYNLMVKNK